MHLNKRRQEERGTNPYRTVFFFPIEMCVFAFLLTQIFYIYFLDEQLLAHVAAKHDPGDALPVLISRRSNIPPAFPAKDHHSGHTTIANYKDTPEYAELGPAARNLVPPPQRGRSDGSGMVYTKSPDYVQNYGKTVRPDKTRNSEA
jgi:hypothetical protein